MNVLILTKEEHIDFLMPCSADYGLEHDVEFRDTYWEDFWDDTEYDVGISFMWTRKIPAEQIRTHTWFNFHPGPLPEYKGRNLCYHALMNGEKEFGATLHYMDESFDTGDIIEVARFPILKWWTAEVLSRWTIEMSKQLFKVYFPLILENTVFPRTPNVGGKYYKKEPIEDTLFLGEYLTKQMRAVYFPPYYPKINIGGVTYKIVRDE